MSESFEKALRAAKVLSKKLAKSGHEGASKSLGLVVHVAESSVEDARRCFVENVLEDVGNFSSMGDAATSDGSLSYDESEEVDGVVEELEDRLHEKLTEELSKSCGCRTA